VGGGRGAVCGGRSCWRRSDVVVVGVESDEWSRRGQQRRLGGGCEGFAFARCSVSDRELDTRKPHYCRPTPTPMLLCANVPVPTKVCVRVCVPGCLCSCVQFWAAPPPGGPWPRRWPNKTRPDFCTPCACCSPPSSLTAASTSLPTCCSDGSWRRAPPMWRRRWSVGACAVCRVACGVMCAACGVWCAACGVCVIGGEDVFWTWRQTFLCLVKTWGWAALHRASGFCVFVTAHLVHVQRAPASPPTPQTLSFHQGYLSLSSPRLSPSLSLSPVLWCRAAPCMPPSCT
jgi:hypothetical protein